MQASFWNPSHGGNLTWAASIAGCSPLTILDFSASINPLGPPQSAIDAIQASLGALVHYPDPGYQALRAALADWHQLSSEWILPGNGAAELLTWAGRELAERAATHLLTPAFGDYLRALQAFNANIITHPLPLSENSSYEGNPLAALLAAVAQQDKEETLSKSGFLLNNPHNPTGQLFLRSAILPLLEQFALVVVDEAFMDFLPPDQQQSLIDLVSDHPNLVIIRSLTKFYSLPGLRLGYAIAHPDRLRRWQRWRDPWSVNSLAEAAAMAAIHDVAFQQKSWNWLPGDRLQLWQGLAAQPHLSPLLGAANFLLVQCDRSVKALQQQLLQQHHILIRDCLSFPELGDRYFRVAVRTTAENQRLIDGLSKTLASFSSPSS